MKNNYPNSGSPCIILEGNLRKMAIKMNQMYALQGDNTRKQAETSKYVRKFWVCFWKMNPDFKELLNSRYPSATAITRFLNKDTIAVTVFEGETK